MILDLLPIVLPPIATVAIFLAAYAGARALGKRWVDAETSQLGKTLVDRTATFLSLILALVFAQEFVTYNATRAAIDREGMLLGDIYYDMRRYDPQNAAPVQAILRTYANQVISVEWPLLARERRLDVHAWDMQEAIHDAILNLEPKDARQTALRQHMLTSIQQLTDEREARAFAALHNVGSGFWIVAIAGVILTAVPFLTFVPTVLNVVLLSGFALYIGIILSLIAAYADPFRPPSMVEPDALRHFVQQISNPDL